MAILKACAKAAATIEVLEKHGIKFSDSEKLAIAKAFGLRGAYKGYLKKTKPNRNKQPLAAAAWLAMQPNPFKISIGSIWFMDGAELDLYEKLSKDPSGGVMRYPDNFDKDKEALKHMGVW